MNAYQKVTLILTLFVLPLVLLFMYGMGYRGAAIVAVFGMAISAAIVYAVRTRTGPSHDDDRGSGRASTTGVTTVRPRPARLAGSARSSCRTAQPRGGAAPRSR